MFSVLVDEEVIKGPGSFIHYEKVWCWFGCLALVVSTAKAENDGVICLRVCPPALMQKEESAGNAFWGISRENLVHGSKVLVGVL